MFLAFEQGLAEFNPITSFAQFNKNNQTAKMPKIFILGRNWSFLAILRVLPGII